MKDRLELKTKQELKQIISECRSVESGTMCHELRIFALSLRLRAQKMIVTFI